MWKISWPKALVLVAATSILTQPLPALADEYILNQNQNGFDLPGVTLPQGQDEVRAADGTTCSSAVSGSGAYLDVGVIRSNRTSATDNDFASYGRVVMPLGRKPKRIDCSRLYELEVERLRMELDLMKMGLGSTSSEIVGSTDAGSTAIAEPAPTKKAKPAMKKANKKAKAAVASATKPWVSDGWTDEARN